MNRSVSCSGVCLLWMCAAWAGDEAQLTIPSASGAVVIDGKLDDAGWQSAQAISFPALDSFGSGGEFRLAGCGAYLCMGARLPERDRVVAHSSGRNPNWWSEDQVQWNIRVHDRRSRRNLNLSLTVNAFGAYRLEGAAGVQSLDGEGRILAASSVGAGEWTVEAAVPIEGFEALGFVDVQRVRAPRPETPELRWYWPAPNVRATVRFAEPTNAAAPVFAPTQRQNAVSSPISDALAQVPGNAWTEGQREKLRPTQMLAESLRRRMAAAAEQEKQAWDDVSSRETWERFRDQRLARLRDWMGPMPARTPLHTLVTRRLNLGKGFVVENLVYESRPGLAVTANLYRPETFSAPIAAIIVVHSHHAPKTQSELQDLGMTWARAGAAVLIPDELCAGERIQSQPWPRESYYARYTLGSQLLLAGDSLMKWMVWDLMRSVDLLMDRPEIDPRRIVMLGAVAGGGDPAAVTAALDPRIAAVIPFNFGEASPEDHYTEGPRPYDFATASPGWGEWETTRSLPRSAVDQFFPWFLCVAVAPRPFLFSFEIGWPIDVEHEPVWSRYKKVFEFYGARDHLDEVHGFGPFPGPGESTNVGVLLRKRIYPILHRWLDVPVPVNEYHDPLPEAALAALTPEAAVAFHPKPAASIVLELAKERLAASRSKELNRSALRAALEAKLGDIDPRPNPSVTRLWENAFPPLTVEAIAIETEPGINIPAYVLKPHPTAGRTPAVLAVSQGGKAQFLAQRSDEILALVRKGVAVCLPDVRGTGEVAATLSRTTGAMEFAVTELMLGGTLPGAQLRDLRTVLHYLKSRPDILPDRIALWGDSFASPNPDDFTFDQSEMQVPGPFPQHQAEPLGSLLVLLAGLYEDSVTAVAARGGLVSYLSALDNRFSHIPEDVVIPGILEVADVADIVDAQAPRPVRLERSVDGRNRLAGPPNPQVSVNPDLAAWIVTQLKTDSRGL